MVVELALERIVSDRRGVCCVDRGVGYSKGETETLCSEMRRETA